ncbi:uncharacterized protein LOC120840839 isoform X1 [Ixodes scapularis]|uniref:uncharacterized protein LOC120840839 isoform X1 n=1 Tax=Ixodes scapularis TaxID=6945 RepID=UPI001C383A21|nr:uncharacterized protein LOC120840839 isoform X1 [Ixodes scapularis]XP_042145350.1 uncharacterized protein LOC120840839 isoform X1 [Ixodes scapularis]XP_042145351.1 uncharacterized protein LOC120840839 isoform X1 [Ixodes scapularis]
MRRFCASSLGGDASHDWLRGCTEILEALDVCGSSVLFFPVPRHEGAGLPPFHQLRDTTSTGLQLQLAHGYRSASCTASSSKGHVKGSGTAFTNRTLPFTEGKVYRLALQLVPGTMTSVSWLSPCPRQQRNTTGGTLDHCTMDAVLYPARHCVWLKWPSRGSLHDFYEAPLAIVSTFWTLMSGDVLLCSTAEHIWWRFSLANYTILKRNTFSGGSV